MVTCVLTGPLEGVRLKIFTFDWDGVRETDGGYIIHKTLEDVCYSRVALLVYDMQIDIFNQAPVLKPVIPQVAAVLEAARAAHVPTFFSRHMSLPRRLMGTSQLRTAMAWQRAD